MQLNSVTTTFLSEHLPRPSIAFLGSNYNYDFSAEFLGFIYKFIFIYLFVVTSDIQTKILFTRSFSSKE